MRARFVAVLTLFSVAGGFASGCTVGARYRVEGETWRLVAAVPPDQREGTAAPVRRVVGDVPVHVRVSSFSEREATIQPDGGVVVPTRTHSRRLVLGSTLVWIGTPLSIAGLLMVILGKDAVRWSGVALSGAAEPVMIAGTVLWVQAAKSRPQEVDRNTMMHYLPFPGTPGGMTR